LSLGLCASRDYPCSRRCWRSRRVLAADRLFIVTPLQSPQPIFRRPSRSSSNAASAKSAECCPFTELTLTGLTASSSIADRITASLTQQGPSRLSLNANGDLGISLACRNARRIRKESPSPSVLRTQFSLGLSRGRRAQNRSSCDYWPLFPAFAGGAVSAKISHCLLVDSLPVHAQCIYWPWIYCARFFPTVTPTRRPFRSSTARGLGS
jgi:hypothetical protein